MNRPRAFILTLSFLVLSTVLAAPPTLLLPFPNARIPVAGVLSGGQPTEDQIASAGAAGLTKDNVARLDAALKEASANGPVLLHCGSGNRIGAMLALRAVWLEGKDPAAAMEYGKASGMTGLESVVKSMLGLAEEAPATPALPAPPK